MATEAQLRVNGVEHDESVELLSERLLIPINSTLKQRIEDYRFDNRHNSVSAAVRHLLELGLKAEMWRGKKPHA